MKMPTRTNLNLTLLIIKNIYLSKKMALYANFHRFERNNLTLRFKVMFQNYYANMNV